MVGNTHALGLASKGVMAGHQIGLASKGWLVRIGESIYIPPKIPDEEEKRTTGPGRRGFREEEEKKRKQQKLVKITVWAYDKKWETEHIVNRDVNISVGDVEVIEKGDGIIEIRLRNLKNEKDIL